MGTRVLINEPWYYLMVRYFDLYATGSLVSAIRDMLYADGSEARRETLRSRGVEVSTRYTPERILPQWEAFIERTMAEQLSLSDLWQCSAIPKLIG